jgi:anoctamin-10
MSSYPPSAAAMHTASHNTAPGPPVSAKVNPNPFNVDLVIPFSIALGSWDRNVAQRYIKEGYEDLIRALEGEGGLRVATKMGRGGKGKEEVWVFIGATEEKVDELVEREK